MSTTITTTTAIQRSSYDAAKLSCCDRGTLQCYRLCRMAHTNEFFPETEELDNCVAQTSEAAVATCFEDGIRKEKTNLKHFRLINNNICGLCFRQLTSLANRAVPIFPFARVSITDRWNSSAIVIPKQMLRLKTFSRNGYE